jgi:hypothetical protein
MSPVAEMNPTDDVLSHVSFWSFVLLQGAALVGEIWLMAWPPIVCGTC